MMIQHVTIKRFGQHSRPAREGGRGGEGGGEEYSTLPWYGGIYESSVYSMAGVIYHGIEIRFRGYDTIYLSLI